MSTGVVKWFDASEGFGSIQSDAGDQDVFVHISAIKMSGLDRLKPGQKISYEIVADHQTGRFYAEKLKSSPPEQMSDWLEIGQIQH